MYKTLCLFVTVLLLTACSAEINQQYNEKAPYLIPTGLVSRSISFENLTGEPGRGGMAVNTALGKGRKGAPARLIKPGEEVQLANIQGAGTLRHIWMTTFPKPSFLRGGVIRVYWDGQKHPSIEAPIGDFFGLSHGKAAGFQSAVHSVGDMAGMNIWLPMPFVKSARVTFTNELEEFLPLFYQIDYTQGDIHPADVGRLHVVFQRQNPTVLGQDFELLPKRTGRGSFIGTVMGINPKADHWWGEGEMKAYLDGDSEFATIVGTGAEDYVGLSWGIQPNDYLYHGASYKEFDNNSDTGRVTMYRWHLKDPIVWQKEARITIQQIGHHNEARFL